MNLSFCATAPTSSVLICASQTLPAATRVRMIDQRGAASGRTDIRPAHCPGEPSSRNMGQRDRQTSLSFTLACCSPGRRRHGRFNTTPDPKRPILVQLHRAGPNAPTNPCWRRSWHCSFACASPCRSYALASLVPVHWSWSFTCICAFACTHSFEDVRTCSIDPTCAQTCWVRSLLRVRCTRTSVGARSSG